MTVQSYPRYGVTLDRVYYIIVVQSYTIIRLTLDVGVCFKKATAFQSGRQTIIMHTYEH